MSSFLVVFNVGSSTLKATGYDLDHDDALVFGVEVEFQSGKCSTSGNAPDTCFEFAPNQFPESIAETILLGTQNQIGLVRACVHRVMHGGTLRTQPVVIDDDVLDELERHEPKCPLHQPVALEVIRHLRACLPSLVQIAVFDTSFHLSQSRLATEYALPFVVRHDGVRAFGFHGISCQYVLRRMREEHAYLANSRLLVAHFGAGASLTAVNNGLSVANSMGFSTLEGLPMGTRSGHVDPGVLLYLLERGWAKSRLTDMLYHQSGLLGLSGISAEISTLLQSGDENAAFAVDYFCYRAAREAASLACAMEGLDAIVFTGGVGQNQPEIRQKIASRLSWLGVQIDDDANLGGEPRIDSEDSRVKMLVMPTNEALEMFLQARCLLQSVR